MGHGGGIITRPFNNYDVAVTLGESSGDTGTLVTSGNINPRSRYKPYAFGNYNTLLIGKDGKENPILKSNNFGMTPATFGWNPYRALPWSQYVPPEAGMNWLRMSDFDRYNHNASGGVRSARIYTNNPKDNRVLMLGGDSTGQEGHIYGEVEFSFDPSSEILPEDFHHPLESGLSLGDFRITLLFGPIQNHDSAFSEAPWVAQSSLSIKEMVHGESSTGTETVEIVLDRTLSNQLRTWTTDSDDFLSILCLAPPIVKNNAGRFSYWQLGSRSGNSLEFNNMRLVSLDMWGDADVQTGSVLFTANGYWDYFSASALYEEIIGVAANEEYLDSEDDEFDDSFIVQMLNGYANGRTLYLDASPFPPIWFPEHSKIRKLRPGISYTLYNSSGQSVYSGTVYGDEVISSGGNGFRTYTIDFDQGITADVYLSSVVPSGTYKLRLRAIAEQTEFPIRYVNGKGYKQIMTHIDWTSDWIADPDGYVQSPYKDFNITI